MRSLQPRVNADRALQPPAMNAPVVPAEQDTHRAAWHRSGRTRLRSASPGEPASPTARKPSECLLARTPAGRPRRAPGGVRKPLPSTSLTTHLTWLQEERKRTSRGAPGFPHHPRAAAAVDSCRVQAPGGGADRAHGRPGPLGQARDSTATPNPSPWLFRGLEDDTRQHRGLRTPGRNSGSQHWQEKDKMDLRQTAAPEWHQLRGQ